jgi:hypothetical protein
MGRFRNPEADPTWVHFPQSDLPLRLKLHRRSTCHYIDSLFRSECYCPPNPKAFASSQCTLARTIERKRMDDSTHYPSRHSLLNHCSAPSTSQTCNSSLTAASVQYHFLWSTLRIRRLYTEWILQQILAPAAQQYSRGCKPSRSSQHKHGLCPRRSQANETT